MKIYFKKIKNEDLGKKIPKYSISFKNISLEFRIYNHSDLSMEIYNDGIYSTVPFKYYQIKLFSFKEGIGEEKFLIEKNPPSYSRTMFVQSNDIDIFG